MSSVKAIPEGLKWVECERGVGGKNSPIRYIPEQDPVQDALVKDKKTTYFKLTLPNTGNELKVAVWASGTPEQFLLHVRSAIHTCKQMGLDTKFAETEQTVIHSELEAELAKEEYVKLCSSKKKKNKGNKPEGSRSEVTNPDSEALAAAKAAYEKALKAIEKSIVDKTIVWIFYPKAKTPLAADLNLMQSWEDLTKLNLAPCGSAAVNEIWTGIRIKTAASQKRSGVGNAEIAHNEYGQYIDVANKIVTLPEDLKIALSAQPEALSYYETLAYSHRKEYVLWVITAKQEKTRTDRIHKMIEKLLSKKKNPAEK